MSDDSPVFQAYERAKSVNVVIYRLSRWSWVVHFADSDDAHPVRLVKDGDSHRGVCECDHHKHTGDTCAHLWAIYLAADREILTIESVKDAHTSDTCPVCEQEINHDIA